MNDIVGGVGAESTAVKLCGRYVVSVFEQDAQRQGLQGMVVVVVVV